MNNNLIKTLLLKLKTAYDPIFSSIGNEDNELNLFELLGYNINNNQYISILNIESILSELNITLDELLNYLNNNELVSFENIFHSLKLFKNSMDKIEALKNELAIFDLDNEQLTSLIEDIHRYLFVYLLSKDFQILYELLVFSKIIEKKNSSETKFSDEGEILTYPYSYEVLNFSALSKFISNPVKIVRENYFDLFNKETSLGAKMFAKNLFPMIGRIANSFGAKSVYGIKKYYNFDFGIIGNEIVQDALTIVWELPFQNSNFGFTLLYSPDEMGGLGWVIAPFGNFNLEFNTEKYFISINSDLNLDAIIINNNGEVQFEGLSNESEVYIKAFVLFQANNLNEDVNLIGVNEGVRIEFREIFFECTFAIKNQKVEFDVNFNLYNSKFVFSGGNGDNFISKVLGNSNYEVPFDLKIGYSNRKSIYINTTIGLETTLPIHKKLLNVIDLHQLILSAKFFDNKIESKVALNLNISLGPINVSINEIGIAANLDWKSQSKNLGFTNLNIGFKPPNGVGINIDTDAVKGGGYLYINTEEGRYAGVAGISIKDKIKLSAFGLINTKFPDGRKGYSFLIFVSAEFSPVQLGFGFTLSGVGGLVGIHRSVNIDKLRAGVKTKAYDRLLFPENPVENALEIIADLEAIFPVLEGRYVFGIMGKIGWGSPTLITIDLGLIIEVPNPVKLAILGVVKAILPDEQKAVLKLQVNFLGVIDFGKKQLSFDATIYDSKLLTFSLAGDMAMRLSWGSNSNFLMSVGGFHPSYQPPPQLISMKRLTLNLLGGDNPRLTLTCYFAVTSNTVQFGAKVELYVKVASKLTAEGHLGFDALFQFNPFYMKILASAYLAIKWNNKEKFSISLSAALEGPKPWNVDGVAEIKVLFIKYKVKVQKTWGQPQDAPLPSVSVTPMLAEAMKKVENWSSELTSGKQQLVTLRKVVTDESIMLPEGVLVISQKVLPMNINIQLFGTQEVNDGGLFSIGDVTLNNNASATSKTYVKEDFVPAHFRKMSETEKLSGPSFQKYDGGIRIDGMNKLQGSEIKPKEIKYETIVYDPVEDSTLPGGSIFENDKIHAAMLKGSKAGQSSLSASKNIAPLAPKPVVVKEEEYGVVKISDLTLVESSALCASFTEAQDYYITKVVEDIAWKNKLKIIPKFEIQTA